MPTIERIDDPPTGTRLRPAARLNARLRRGLAATGRDFLHLWVAATVSQLGSQVTLLALPLAAVLDLHADAVQMGLLMAAGTAPSLLVGLLAGAWVDRLRRRPLLIAADLGRAALLATIPVAWLLGALHMELLYVVSFLAGLLTVFFDVAQLALVPALVSRGALVAASSRLRASDATAQVAGPGLAGVLVGAVGAPLAIVADAASFLASAGLIVRIRAQEVPRPAEVQPRLRREIGEGLRVVLGSPYLRAMAGASATTSLFGYVFLAVYVLYLDRDLHLGPTAIGLVFGCGGVGSLLGSALAEPAARRFGTGATIVAGRILFGLGGLTIPLAIYFPRHALPLVLASEFLQWGMLVIADVNQLGLRLALTPARLQGRVNATVRFLTAGMVPIGSLIGGALGQVLGYPTALVVGALGMLTAAAWFAGSPVPRLRAMPDPAGEETVED
ncbi:MAG TPA: MFS transporter, partial [Thermomicrobiaceae bacterium]|nr:MFS transporter [Thermomicrobiaceae bacterium]